MGSKLIIFACLLAISHSRSVVDDLDIKNLVIQRMALGSRIIGGQDAKVGEFPHQVSLQMGIKDVLDVEHFCGGSIISEQYILTAAHCVDAVEDIINLLSPLPIKIPVDFIVKAGKQNLNKTESSEQIVEVDKWVKHEQWSPHPKVEVGPYDIALLKLKAPLRLNKRVAKIRLPKAGSEPTGDAVLSGWGAVSNDTKERKMPEVLQTLVTPIIPRDVCNEAVERITTEDGEEVIKDAVKETNVCTGPIYGGHSACVGDSGGPLILEAEDGELEVIGVVSWGMEPCGRKGAPAVFTKVSAYVDWIENAKKSKF